MPFLAQLNVALALAALVVAVWWVALHGARRAWCLGYLAFGVVACVGAYRLVPAEWLWSWMTVLREGGSQVLALAVEARPSTANANYLAVAAAASQGYAVPIEGVLRGNLALAALNAALFAAVATQVFESRFAPLVVLVALATNPFFLAAAVCELPAQLATTYFLIGVACFASLDGRAGRALERLAVAALALCTVLSMLTRIEWAIVALPALVLAASRVFARTHHDDLMRRVREGIGATARYLNSSSAPWPLFVFAVLVAAGLVFEPQEPHARAAFRALNPVDASVLAYPAVLSTWLSAGAVGLALFGWWYAVKSPGRFGLLPLTLPCLFKAYYASCHNGVAAYEMFRYQNLLNPMAVFLALFGWRQLTSWAGRLHPPLRRRWLVAAVSVSLFSFWPGMLGLTSLRSIITAKAGDVSAAGSWLPLNAQREARFIARARREHPECRIVIPTAARIRHRGGDDGTTRFEPGRYLVIGTDGPREYAASTLGELRDAAPQEFGECTFYYRGLDCHIVDYAGCAEDLSTLRRVQHSRFLSQPYGEPEEWGPYVGTIELSLHRVPRSGDRG